MTGRDDTIIPPSTILAEGQDLGAGDNDRQINPTTPTKVLTEENGVSEASKTYKPGEKWSNQEVQSLPHK